MTRAPRSRLTRPGMFYVAGYTASANFPLVAALQPGSAGGNEGFIVKISAPNLTGVSLAPATVTGGSANSTGTVTLNAAAPTGGAIVTLASSNTNAATLPPSVTVAAGATQATFAVVSKAVTAGTIATITATYNGLSKTASLVVNPLLGSITLNPSVLTGGAGSTGTVTLSTAAPAGGARRDPDQQQPRRGHCSRLGDSGRRRDDSYVRGHEYAGHRRHIR